MLGGDEANTVDECDVEKILVPLIVARKRSLSWEIDGGHRRRNRKGIR